MAQPIRFAVVVASLEPAGTGKPVPEPEFCKALSVLGARYGIDVYVCSAESFDQRTGQLSAWRWDKDGWSVKPAALPDIVYDRCFYVAAEQRFATRRMLQRMARLKPHRLLGGGLPGKAEVYEALQRNKAIDRYLPPSFNWQASGPTVSELLEQYAAGFVLKPSAGMQGRGIIHIARSPQGGNIIAKGRTDANRCRERQFASAAACGRWLSHVTNRAKYIVQPYLELRSEDGKPFDVRTLLQKDGAGRWAVTGSALRCGEAGSLTSNLHGGGNAEPALQALAAKFGLRKAEHLLQQLHTISKQTAAALESGFGRLAELGLDFGIEQDGRIWLLEANSKPGRSSFRLIRDQTAWRLSAERPLRYAQWMVRRPSSSAISADGITDQTPYLISGNLKRPFNVQEVHR
jgi:glutathione synthase/RimK-type ligase-like ATP-grasp enzyme